MSVSSNLLTDVSRPTAGVRYLVEGRHHVSQPITEFPCPATGRMTSVGHVLDKDNSSNWPTDMSRPITECPLSGNWITLSTIGRLTTVSQLLDFLVPLLAD